MQEYSTPGTKFRKVKKKEMYEKETLRFIIKCSLSFK